MGFVVGFKGGIRVKAGISMAVDANGNVISARLMGGLDECLSIDWPYHRWCVLPYPHDGEHEYNFPPTERILFEETT